MDKKRILVGSPVYQKPAILKAFLASLKNIVRDTISVDYIFVDDNVDESSVKQLAEFKREDSEVYIINGKDGGSYLCNDESHQWNDDLMLKVANYKNIIINFAKEKKYDYLFFADSDLVLHPYLIEHLKAADKDIISEIFWTKWHPDRPLEPNVWMFDEYDLIPKKLGENLTQKEMDIRQSRFLNQLRHPGVYEVGGLGACTLVSKAALAAGVSFSPIKNLTIHGEDRFFCIRAAVLDIELFVDTHYPAYHIYRQQDLNGVQAYVKSNEAELAFKRRYRVYGNKLTLSMIVKNEEKRYLKQVLGSLVGHIDAAVIIDDGCTDNTIELCENILKDIPVHIIKNDKSMFEHEISLRKKQWNETIKIDPNWILILDADEVIEESFWPHAQRLINDPAFDLYCFRLYDMWDETHYREDKYWNAHSSYRPFLIRYQPEFNYKWHETPQHCGRFPANICSLPSAATAFRVQHFGWATLKDRTEKKERYQLLDPDAIYGIKEQYDSIMDLYPDLVKWEGVENT